MSKIIKAIESMIANSKKIDNVAKGISKVNDEYFFLYDKKYKWSILYKKAEEKYYLYFYPNGRTINELANITSWQGEGYVIYRSEDFDNPGIFEDLFSLMKEKLYKLDEALDEIIKSGQ
jgi:hypothetical protein